MNRHLFPAFSTCHNCAGPIRCADSTADWAHADGQTLCVMHHLSSGSTFTRHDIVATPTTETTTTIRIGGIVAGDWDDRDLAQTIDYENASGTPDAWSPNPYANVPGTGGTVIVTAPDLREIIADCAYQADPYGPNEDDRSRRDAYKRVMTNARKALAKIEAGS
jgi:hypothetical protein